MGQAGRNDTAGRHAHIDFHVVEIQAVDGLIERTQCTDFIDGTQWPTACECKADTARTFFSHCLHSTQWPDEKKSLHGDRDLLGWLRTGVGAAFQDHPPSDSGWICV